MRKGILTAFFALVFISYAISAPCSLPIVGSISGPKQVCVGSVINLTDTTSGGIWGSTNSNIATVDSSGTIMGVAAGNDTIIYSVTNTCGTSNVIYLIYVNALPTVNAISNQTVCAGAQLTTISFSGNMPGTIYTWTNNNTSIGLAASGVGNIAPFTATDSFNADLVSTITVTPVSLPGYVYIANEVSSTVSVISTMSNTVINTIHVGSDPFGVAVSPDGSKVYVTNIGSDNVSVINTSTNLVANTVDVGVGPEGISVSPDGSNVYVANYGDGTVSVINALTNHVTSIIGVGTDPVGIVVSLDGSKVYVANWASNNVSVIDVSTNSVSATITVGRQPYAIAVSPDGGKVYVTNWTDGTLSVIDTTTNLATNTINVGGNPEGITLSSDGGTVFVANQAGYVSIINAASDSVRNTINVGFYPAGISLSPDGGKVFVANSGSNTMSVINTFNNTVTNNVIVGSDPYSIGNFVAGGDGCTGTPITFSITVAPLSVSQFSNYICAGQAYTFGNQNLTQSGSFIDTFQTVSGCDSIVTLNLTVTPEQQTTLNVTACNGMVIMFNGHGLTNTGIYRDTLQSTNGCDSVVTLILLFDSLPHPLITRIGDTLQTETFASYQWLLNGANVINDTAQSIIITQNGNYSVVVTNPNGCIDTSTELSVTSLGVQDITGLHSVKLYPNPTGDVINIYSAGSEILTANLSDVSGKVILEGVEFTSSVKTLDLSGYSAGVYLLRIANKEGNSMVVKVVKE